MKATTVSCDSQISQVVVYARGAVVTRSLSLPAALPDERLELVTTGVSPLAQPGSLRVRSEGDRRVIGVRSRLEIPKGIRAGDPIEHLKELSRQNRALERRLAEIDDSRERLRQIEISLAMHGRSQKLDPSQRIGDGLAASRLVTELIADLDEKQRALEEEIRKVRERIVEAKVAINHERGEALAGEDHPTRTVHVHVAKGSGDLASLALSYVVTAARWWPAYTARLEEDGPARLSLEAFVAQASFEDWNDVTLGLSTADLAHGIELPKLPSLRLGRRQAPQRSGYRAAPEGLDELFAPYDEIMKAVPRHTASSESGVSGDELIPSDWSQSDQSLITGVRTHPRVREARAGKKLQAPPIPGGQPLVGHGGPPPPQGAPAPMGDAVANDAPMAAYEPQMVMPAMAKSKGGSILRAAAMPFAAAAAAPFVAGEMVKDGIARRRAPEGAGGGGVQRFAHAEPDAIQPAQGWLDFDALTMRGVEEGSMRGRLGRRSERGPALPLPKDLASPRHVTDPTESRGKFDHRFDSSGTVSVPSNALSHRVPLAESSAEHRARFVSVPREREEVYREVVVDNPFESPLLAGPVDVFVSGALVTTSRIEAVDRGGQMSFGLGVEERLRVARNARAEESTVGMLGGKTEVRHDISIEIASSLGRMVDVEVVDRLPVTDDKDVDIERLESRPEPRSYNQADRGQPIRGGLHWKVPVNPGARATIEFAYKLTLSSKEEVVGGNRRE